MSSGTEKMSMLLNMIESQLREELNAKLKEELMRKIISTEEYIERVKEKLSELKKDLGPEKNQNSNATADNDSTSMTQLNTAISSATSAKQSLESNRSFSIDCGNDVFLKDGKPFQFVSGSLHYFRVPRPYWRDRLRKCRAAGLNTVSTYVEWSTHEPSPGQYRFTGEDDLEYFVTLAQEEDLLVILRIGPYICADRDFGGLPPWLLTLHPNIEVRTDNEDYQAEVKKWFDVLMPKMTRHLYGLGGPIIMLQLENGDGASPKHKVWLRDLIEPYVKKHAVLFTVDAGNENALRAGSIPDVYPTIAFCSASNIDNNFQEMRKVSPRGPLVVSEFYLGWFSQWKKPFNRIDKQYVIKQMEELFERNVNLNLFMFHGGTNFGFKNGAELKLGLKSYVTSYDYDAPLDEAGDPTEKYYEIRNLIGKHFPLPNILAPKPAPRANYGVVTLKPVVSLFDHHVIPDTKTFVAETPLTFEAMQLNYGYVLYETKMPADVADMAVLLVPNLRDRAVIFVNQVAVSILSGEPFKDRTILMGIPNAKCSLFVENQGRVNIRSQMNDNRKGLLETPLLNDAILANWTMTTFPFSDVKWVPVLSNALPENVRNAIRTPAVYYGELVLPASTIPQNTFIDPSGWGKGIIFVNDYNLGRYWPSAGPQVTLFVPGCYLRPAPEKNCIVLVEIEYAHPELRVIFTDKHNINKI